VERIVLNRSATLYKTFYADGVATDPTGTPTVVITRLSDGSAVTAGAVTNEAPTGVFSVTIPATSNTLLDTYTVDWTAVVATVDQEYVDTVEVAGDVLFTIAEMRALSPLSNTTTYPSSRLVEMRTTVEQAIEDEYGAALVPRYSLDTVRVNGRGLRIKKAPREIRSLTVGETEYTDLTGIVFDENGFVGGPDLDFVTTSQVTWTSAVIGYEHGLDRPPPRIKMDALRLLRSWVVAGPIDDRAATYSLADGGSYAMVVPGRNRSVFGLPDLDAAINASPYRVGVA
jgi:hypothetical protein